MLPKIYMFGLELGGPWHSGAPGHCPPCPPYCYATVCGSGCFVSMARINIPNFQIPYMKLFHVSANQECWSLAYRLLLTASSSYLILLYYRHRRIGLLLVTAAQPSARGQASELNRRIKESIRPTNNQSHRLEIYGSANNNSRSFVKPVRLRCFIHRLISPMHQTCTRLLLNSSVDLSRVIKLRCWKLNLIKKIVNRKTRRSY